MSGKGPERTRWGLILFGAWYRRWHCLVGLERSHRAG